MTPSEGRTDGFAAFYRRYTKTWVHALSTVALTAFGTLTVVDHLFAVVAIAAYIVPLVAQYLRYSPERSPETTDESAGANEVETAGATEAEAANGTGAPSDVPTAGAARTGESNVPEPASSEPTSAESTSTESSPTEPAPTESKPAAVEPKPGESNSRTAGAADAVETAQPSEPEWVAVDAPTDEMLFDVALAGEDAYAVGSGGVVVAGSDEEWRVVLSDGPGAAGNALRGVDTAPDGVWVAGDGGAVGRIDAATGRHVDYSAPDGDTSNVAAVAAAGDPGDETVLLADGSGRVRRGRYRDGELSWDDPVKPGSGSSIAGVVLRDDGVGYLCDTSDGAYRTADGGRTFESVGPVGADGTLTDAAVIGPETCLFSADDGVVHRYGGTTWTPERVGEATLTGVAASEELAVSCADDGSVYERTQESDWDRCEAVAAAMHGAAVEGAAAVVVGAEGVVRRRGSRA